MTMTTCAKCTKEIKGKGIVTSPSNLEIQLGLAKVEWFHTKCWAQSEAARDQNQAALEVK